MRSREREKASTKALLPAYPAGEGEEENTCAQQGARKGVHKGLAARVPFGQENAQRLLSRVCASEGRQGREKALRPTIHTQEARVRWTNKHDPPSRTRNP